MKRAAARRLAIAALLLVASSACLARFARTWEPVPLDRLLRNVEAVARRRPRDPMPIYTLGRLHALAFAQGSSSATVDVVMKDWSTRKPLDVPQFPRFASVQVVRAKPGVPPTAEVVGHLKESVRLYRRAMELDPKNALFILGCAWMIEQGAPYAASIGRLPGLPKPAPGAWRSGALALYRRAYAIEMPKHLRAGSRSLNGGDAMIGVEAGQGIVRLLGPDPRTAAEKAELQRVQQEIKTAESRPGWITPIVVSLRPGARLADLLAPGRTVSFDLAAIGERQRWPWLRAEAGLLVWDPLRRGRITSGSQLFGSRTWQMIWRNGYEPLAALDDNRDGWLSGRELAGLAVWFDRNGDGRSDRGEVVPVGKLGIIRVRVSASGMSAGVLANPVGVQLRSGAFCPTYDWTPRAIP